MAETMIERVARALAEQHDENPDAIDQRGLVLGKQLARWRYYAPMAAATIAAMREPTDLMGLGLCQMGGEYTPGSHSATQIWRGMIDAALTEHAD